MTWHLPLFHPRLVRERMAVVSKAAFDEHRDLVRPWIDQLRSGQLEEAKETSLHGGFLESIFGRILGYRTQAHAKDGTFDLGAEASVVGGSADAAIGVFRQGGERHVAAPIELKGASHPLEQAKGRKLTPVQQGWDYGNKLPESRFIIVSNFRETRLYAKAMGPAHYELFRLEELDDVDGFRRFVALLGRDALLGVAPPAPSALEEMLVRSQQADREITARLYSQYRKLRVDLFAHLQQRHGNIPATELLTLTQTVLDRMLFLAFAEDRGLIPGKSIANAVDHKDYDQRPIWQNFVALFRFVDKGNEARQIPAYNGGLFAHQPALDDLEVTDEACGWFKQLAEYDFRDDVSVDVLGHIFEQSIADLEELRREAHAKSSPVPEPESSKKKPSKRKTEGIFYTPPFVTAFLVRETLQVAFGEALERAEATVMAKAEEQRAKKGQLPPPKDRQIWTWEAYQNELRKLRVLDPACGSGAFLVAAFDALAAEFDRANRNLAALKGHQQSLFDLNKTVLNENLFGIDLNGESVEITRLSLWLKTAERDKALAFLDRNIQRGNSVVSDPTVDVAAFDWDRGMRARDGAFIEPQHAGLAKEVDARWRDGFDVVLGNPPYVRQELLKPFKKHWEKEFDAYDGTADLFVYFFERGLSVLKPGGRLGFIVSNKWLKGGYAEELRSLLAGKFTVERVVDFGHAPIFEDADAFPCIIVIQKTAPPVGHSIEVTQYPREELGKEVLQSYIESHNFPVPQASLGKAGWMLEPPAVTALMAKIRRAGRPLAEVAQKKPFRGLLTGLNDAFVIDQSTRDALVDEHPNSADIVKPFLRGEDIQRWGAVWDGEWMIVARRGVEIERFPAILRHLTKFRSRLEPRPRSLPENANWEGRKAGGYAWYELQDAADYISQFSQTKIVYQEIQFHPRYALDKSGMLTNNKCYFIPTDDHWVLACLNSAMLWWYNWRFLVHLKDEALSTAGDKMVDIPISAPDELSREVVRKAVENVAALTREQQLAQRAFLAFLNLEFGIERPGDALSTPWELDRDHFLGQVRSRREKNRALTPPTVAMLDEVWERDVQTMKARAETTAGVERSIAAEVHKAYGLTPADEELLWATAPPRMPIGRPGG